MAFPGLLEREPEILLSTSQIAKSDMLIWKKKDTQM